MRATIHAETADGDALLGALFLVLNEGKDAENVWTGNAGDTSVDLECPLRFGALPEDSPIRYAFAARIVSEDLERAAMNEAVPQFGPLTISITD